MLDLAPAVDASAAGNRVTLIEGRVKAAPSGPFDAATCILVLGLVKDDGAKLALLSETRGKLKAGAPFILVDQCIDLAAADAGRRLDRDASFARRSGVDPGVVAGARAAVGQMATMVPDWRNVQLLEEASFPTPQSSTAAWRGAAGWPMRDRAGLAANLASPAPARRRSTATPARARRGMTGFWR